MSGEKRTPIQILQDEMRQNRSQLYSIEKQREQLQQELGKVRKENAGKMNILQSQMEEREQKQAAVTASLKSDMRDMALQHNRQISEQRKLVLGEMQKLEELTDQKVEDLRKWTQNRINEQRREYTRLIQQQQKDLNLLKRDIENINRREDNREKRAKEYLLDLETLIKATDENLPHQRFMPGRLVRIKRQLEAAQRQLKEDVAPATIATVQAAHFDLMDLETEVQRLETEYELTYRAVADSVGGLLEAVRKNRHIQLEDQAVLQEADYWTQGRYMDLENRVEAIKMQIDEKKHTLSTDELNGYLDDIETLNAEQEKLIGEAVERIISSQLRAEMGDTVIEQLGRQGFVIKAQEQGYEENDQRRAYMVKLHNVAGTEIVTVISPDEKTYQNTLSVNTYNDEAFDDQARYLRNKDILKALKEAGLQLGTTECNEDSIKEFYDVESIIKANSTGISKKAVRQAVALPSQKTKPGASNTTE